MISVECVNCGCEYPPTACRWRCPMCGFKDTCCDGEPQRPASGRRPLERPNKYRDRYTLGEDYYVD